ncbi:amidohydrolase family protein [Paenibacillus ginsengarvi]|uniref:Amidohydrolase n=1 Tax=Paenibacillus ginsengarvi TaxID=400777 RepID=A0A3B0BNM1_9BACL|nr:amidohydrolase family protein [Paenibacillus ginsengarvi]RKN74124.1 amidohydrolase [Paenibacillus ginsengarvi]
MKTATQVIDCDIHHAFKDHRQYGAYLRRHWKGPIPGGGAGVYASPIGVHRKDAYSDAGESAAADPKLLTEFLMEPYDMAYGILTGSSYDISVHPNADFAAAVAAAYNDHLLEEWLPYNPRFKGSMTVAVQDPQLAVREIDRIAPHPDIVQLVLASAARLPYGHRYYHPIYEAAERHGLPVAIHPGSEGSGISGAPTAAGYVSNYMQWHTSLSQNFMAHLVSLVCEGVFERFPKLKFVLVEGGVAWLPHLMWRMDKNYKALRSTTPWLKKMPSRYIREHCYLTTQPIEEPDNAKHLQQIFDMIDAENILLFSSDFPHWDFDDPFMILKGISGEMKEKIMYRNAKELYSLS